MVKQSAAHWKPVRIKRLLRERSEKGWSTKPLLAATQQYGVVLKEKYEERTVLPESGIDQFKLVQPGDFVISLRIFPGRNRNRSRWKA